MEEGVLKRWSGDISLMLSLLIFPAPMIADRGNYSPDISDTIKCFQHENLLSWSCSVRIAYGFT
jgi:hypothetical protein